MNNKRSEKLIEKIDLLRITIDCMTDESSKWSEKMSALDKASKLIDEITAQNKNKGEAEYISEEELCKILYEFQKKNKD